MQYVLKLAKLTLARSRVRSFVRPYSPVRCALSMTPYHNLCKIISWDSNLDNAHADVRYRLLSRNARHLNGTLTPTQVTYCVRHVQPPSLQNAESADGQHGRGLGLPSILSKLRSITFASTLAGTL